MADATPAPVATTAPTATPTPAAETAPVDIVEQAFARISAEVAEEEARAPQTDPAPPPDGTEQETQEEPAEAEAQAEEQPAEQTGEQLEAADEALFSDDALKTPAGVKAAAERLRALRAEQKQASAALAKKQKEVDHDFRVLRHKQASFKKTKEEHLAWHSQQRDQARLLGQHVQMLRQGTPAQVVESLGYLTGRDGLSIYEEIVKNAAGLRQQPNPDIEAVRQEYEARFAALEQRLQEQRDAEQIEAKRAQIAQREAKIIESAKDSQKYPALAHFVAASPREVLAELRAMGTAYRAETGEALPLAQAMLELNAKLAPYLPAGGGGAGQPRAEQAQNPGGQSSPSSPTKSPGGVAGIPPSASARVAPVRPATEEERRQELTPEFFQDIGLW